MSKPLPTTWATYPLFTNDTYYMALGTEPAGTVCGVVACKFSLRQAYDSRLGQQQAKNKPGQALN